MVKRPPPSGCYMKNGWSKDRRRATIQGTDEGGLARQRQWREMCPDDVLWAAPTFWQVGVGLDTRPP